MNSAGGKRRPRIWERPTWLAVAPAFQLTWEDTLPIHIVRSRKEREEKAARLHVLISIPTRKREKERQAREVSKHHCVFVALKDGYNLGKKSSPGGSTNFPMNLFSLFFVLTASNGWQTAGQANPALDLGSRCMASVIGYPDTIWTFPYTFSGYSWVPIIIPFIGACLGAWLYDLLIFMGVIPVNTPEMGVKKLYSPMLNWSNRRERLKQRRDPETAMP